MDEAEVGGKPGETIPTVVGSKVSIQTSAQSVPSTPAWLGEGTVVAHYLRHLGAMRED